MDLSVVLPVYNEVASLAPICDQFEACIPKDRSYELIFVNDGNIHNRVYETLESLRSRPSVRVIHLSRNFGQHVAVAAGMKNSRGNHVLVLDADLQLLPKDAYQLYVHALENKKPIVLSILMSSRHSFLKTRLSELYYALMKLLGAPHVGMAPAYLIQRHVAEGLLKMGDRYRLTIPMIYWLGGDIGYMKIPHYKRPYGKSGYNLTRSIRHAISGITGFSATPLYISLALSLGFGLFAIVLASVLLFKRIYLNQPFLTGWLATFLLILISVSIVLGCLGIIGLYLARIFESVHGRPLYFVQYQERTSGEAVKLFED